MLLIQMSMSRVNQLCKLPAKYLQRNPKENGMSNNLRGKSQSLSTDHIPCHCYYTRRQFFLLSFINLPMISLEFNKSPILLSMQY
jgi:hypothetical protein